MQPNDDTTVDHEAIIKRRRVQAARESFMQDSAPMQRERAGERMESFRQQLRQPPRRAEQAIGGEEPEEKITAGDVVRNVAEIPAQVVGGALEAGKETLQTFDMLGDWLNENVADLRMGDTGSEFLNNPLEWGGENLPQVPEPKTTTGALARGVSQFLTGLWGAGKFIGTANKARAGARWANIMMRGAMSDAAAFDEMDGSLSNLVQEFPALRNPITEYLSTDPEDGAGENKLRRALEGLALGAMVDGLILTARTVRNYRLSRGTKAPVPEPVPEVTAKRDFLAMGDLDAPLVRQKAAPRVHRDIRNAISDVTDDEALSILDRLMAAKGEAAGPVEDELDRLLNMVRGDIPIPQPKGSVGLLSFLKSQGGLKDFQGEVTSILGGPRSRPGLLRNNGLELDEATQRAWDAGYLTGSERPEINDLLEAIRRDYSGGGVFRQDDTARQMFDAQREAVDEMDQYLYRLGLDPDDMTNEQIRRALTQVDDTGAGRAATQAEMEGMAPLIGSAEEPVFINWARIDSPDDVKAVIGEMANIGRKGVEGARRGKMTFEQIKMGAKEQDAWKLVRERRQGQPWSAEEAVAVRNLWTMSGRKLTELATRAADNPTPANQFAFQKMLGIHRLMQEQVIGGRTETARALASWRIPAGNDAMRARQIEFLLDQAGGSSVTVDLARKIKALGDNADLREAFVRKSIGAKTIDAVRTVWINGLLSGPKTHLVNAISNTGVLFQQMQERWVAERFSTALGTEGGVEVGEAAAQWFGMVQGARDILRYTGSLLRLDPRRLPNPFENPATAMQRSKIDVNAAASAENIVSSGWLGRAADGINTVVHIPSAALNGSDQFFKTFGYRMELNARALRMAAEEVRAGKIPESGLKTRIAELVDNPPPTLQVQAVDQALYNTFQNAPGKFGQGLMKFRNSSGMAGWVIMPFVRTPINIASYAFERAPLLNALNGRWRADFAAGGARRDIALARLASGATIMLAVTDLALNEQVTGAGGRGKHKPTGWQPYSVGFPTSDGGQRYFSYRRMDPVGMTIGLAADMVDILHNTDFDKRDTKSTQEMASAVMSAISANVVSKTYMQGIADFMNAVSGSIGSESAFDRYVSRLGGSVVPTGVAEVARGMDPYMREARTIVDSMAARTPGISEGLPLNRDFWGRERPYSSGLGWVYDAVSPVYSRRLDPTPIDNALIENGISFMMPPRVQTITGIPIDLDRHPGAYSRMLELSGQVLKDPVTGKNMLGTLNDLVSNKHPLSAIYQMQTPGPDGSKKAMIGKTITGFRTRARDQLPREFPSIATEIREKTPNPYGVPLLESR